MGRSKFFKQILAILLITLILLFANVGVVNASIQSNPNTHYKKIDVPTGWISKFREMETSGETMGLNETLNDDLTPLSESNGIDVHMIKSTEYGATVILSASGYGYNQKVTTTTTGNDTGVMINTGTTGITFQGDYREWVAGGIEEIIFTGINGRYYDTYTIQQNSARIGDALGSSTTINPGCAKWHSTSSAGWVSKNAAKGYFARNLHGLFAYGSAGFGNFSGGQKNTGTGYARGVVVCGDGL